MTIFPSNHFASLYQRYRFFAALAWVSVKFTIMVASFIVNLFHGFFSLPPSFLIIFFEFFIPNHHESCTLLKKYFAYLMHLWSPLSDCYIYLPPKIPCCYQRRYLYLSLYVIVCMVLSLCAEVCICGCISLSDPMSGKFESMVCGYDKVIWNIDISRDNIPSENDQFDLNRLTLVIFKCRCFCAGDGLSEHNSPNMISQSYFATILKNKSRKFRSEIVSGMLYI